MIKKQRTSREQFKSLSSKYTYSIQFIKSFQTPNRISSKYVIAFSYQTQSYLKKMSKKIEKYHLRQTALYETSQKITSCAYKKKKMVLQQKKSKVNPEKVPCYSSQFESLVRCPNCYRIQNMLRLENQWLQKLSKQNIPKVTVSQVIKKDVDPFCTNTILEFHSKHIHTIIQKISGSHIIQQVAKEQINKLERFFIMVKEQSDRKIKTLQDTIIEKTKENSQLLAEYHMLEQNISNHVGEQKRQQKKQIELLQHENEVFRLQLKINKQKIQGRFTRQQSF